MQNSGIAWISFLWLFMSLSGIYDSWGSRVRCERCHVFTLLTSLHCLPVLVTFPVHFLTLSPCFFHFSCSLSYTVSLFWSLFLFTSLRCLPVFFTFPVHFLTLSPCFGHFSCSLPYTVTLFWSLFLFKSNLSSFKETVGSPRLPWRSRRSRSSLPRHSEPSSTDVYWAVWHRTSAWDSDFWRSACDPRTHPGSTGSRWSHAASASVTSRRWSNRGSVWIGRGGTIFSSTFETFLPFCTDTRNTWWRQRRPTDTGRRCDRNFRWTFEDRDYCP